MSVGQRRLGAWQVLITISLVIAPLSAHGKTFTPVHSPTLCVLACVTHCTVDQFKCVCVCCMHACMNPVTPAPALKENDGWQELLCAASADI